MELNCVFFFDIKSFICKIAVYSLPLLWHILQHVHAVGGRFAPHLGHTKDHHNNGTHCLPAWHACFRVEF